MKNKLVWQIIVIIFSIIFVFNISSCYFIRKLYKDELTWNLEQINVGNSWSITTGRRDIVVAIIGYGVDTENEHIKDNIIDSWNFVSNTSYIPDRTGHDTYAAGIVLSIAPDVSIITAKIFIDNHQDKRKLGDAIRWATKKEANVILMPITILEPEPTPDYINDVQSSIINAYANGVRFIIGAQGRGGLPTPRFPGRLKGVYNISGITKDYKHSRYSTANHFSFVSAPCENIPSIPTEGDWFNIAGTSWSSAHAAGVAALKLSVNPFLTTKNIEDILIDNAKKLGYFDYDIYYGYGLIDCYNSLKSARDKFYENITKNFYYYNQIQAPKRNDLPFLN